MKAWILLQAQWDRALGIVLIAVGGIGLLLGYRGVSEAVFVGQQLAYVVSGGLGGLFLGAVGVSLLVSADLHDEWRKLDRIEAAIRGEGAPDATEVLLSASSAPREHENQDTRRSLQVTAFSRLSLPEAAPGGAALAIDWQAGGIRRALAATGAAVAAAAGVLAIGWRDAATSTDAIDGFSGVGVAAAALACGALLVSLYPVWLRSTTAKRKRALLGGWLWQVEGADRQRQAAFSRRPVDPDRYLVAAGLHRFHVAGCPSLAGVAASSVAPADLDPGLQPCGICQPA